MSRKGLLCILQLYLKCFSILSYTTSCITKTCHQPISSLYDSEHIQIDKAGYLLNTPNPSPLTPSTVPTSNSSLHFSAT